MDQLKSNPNLYKWWDCIKQLAGYPKRRAISSMVLDNEIVTGDALANKINNFFTSITNQVTPLQPEPSENQFEFNECYFELQFIIDEESVFDKLSNISKSFGSDGIPNWVLKDYAYIQHRYSNNMFPQYGKKRKLFQFPKHQYLQMSQLISVLIHGHLPCPKFLNHLYPIG